MTEEVKAPISVIVGTFGGPEWVRKAQRAVASAHAQSMKPTEVIHSHKATLHEARNLGAAEAKSEWLCFLDADDELDGDYIAEMAKAIEGLDPGDYLLQPSTLGVADDKEDPFPVLIPKKNLLDGNFLIIGTVVRRDQFSRLGGFDDLPCYEDWEMWLNMHTDGAVHVPVPAAVYRVHVNPNGRNNPSREMQVKYYNLIRNRYLKRGTR